MTWPLPAHSGVLTSDRTTDTPWGVANALLRVLLQVGPHDQASHIGEDNLVRCRRVLGDNHPETLRAAHLLAGWLHRMGAFERARQLDADTLVHKQRVLGDDYPDLFGLGT